MKARRLIWFDFGENPSSNFPGSIHPDFVNEVLQHHRHHPQGTWVLIGLDGGVKLSGTGPPDWRLVFRTIDAMPMRKAEIIRGI
jgi:hypothetical protein